MIILKPELVSGDKPTDNINGTKEKCLVLILVAQEQNFD